MRISYFPHKRISFIKGFVKFSIHPKASGKFYFFLSFKYFTYLNTSIHLLKWQNDILQKLIYFSNLKIICNQDYKKKSVLNMLHKEILKNKKKSKKIKIIHKILQLTQSFVLTCVH